MQTKIQLKHPAGKKAVSMDKAKYDLLKNGLSSTWKQEMKLSRSETHHLLNLQLSGRTTDSGQNIPAFNTKGLDGA